MDLATDQSFRAAGLEAPYRYYYLVLFIVCALLCYTRPALSVLVTLLESSTNMLILLLGVMLSGSMICWSFYQSLDKLKGVRLRC